MATKRKTSEPRRQENNLGALIKVALDKRGLRQKDLIHALPFTALQSKKQRQTQTPAGTYIKEIMGGKRVPDLKYLIDILVALETSPGKVPAINTEELGLWLASWLTNTLERFSGELRRAVTDKTKSSSKGKKRKVAMHRGLAFWAYHDKEASLILKQATKAASQWQSRKSTGIRSKISGPPTLKAKGEILRNCIIIVGASVRYPPTSTLDLFRENAHLSDLMYLPYFDFGDEPRLLTDRMVIALSEEDRRRILGPKHLLIIGGPKVNVASRFLNDGFVFPFCFAASKKGYENMFDALKRRETLSNEEAVELFYEMLQVNNEIDLDDERFRKFKPASLRQRVRDEVLAFREAFTEKEPLGYEQIMKLLTGEKKIFDPLAQDLISPESNQHLGVVTMGKNYWAGDDPNRVCLLVGGVDTYGTAGALKALVESDFQRHPLGGIVKISMNKSISEYEEFNSTVFRWRSQGYEIAGLVRKLPGMKLNLSTPGRAVNEAFHGDVDRFSEYEKFIQRFQD